MLWCHEGCHVVCVRTCPPIWSSGSGVTSVGPLSKAASVRCATSQRERQAAWTWGSCLQSQRVSWVISVTVQDRASSMQAVKHRFKYKHTKEEPEFRSAISQMDVTAIISLVKISPRNVTWSLWLFLLALWNGFLNDVCCDFNPSVLNSAGALFWGAKG